MLRKQRKDLARQASARDGHVDDDLAIDSDEENDEEENTSSSKSSAEYTPGKRRKGNDGKVQKKHSLVCY